MPKDQSSDADDKNVLPFVLSVTSLVTWILPIIGVPLSVVAIVLNVRSRYKLYPIGIALSIIGLTLSLVNAYWGYQQDVQRRQQEETRQVQERSPSPEEQADLAEGYPFEFEYNFQSACIANGGTESSCACSLSVLQDMYAYLEVTAFEAQGAYPPEYLNRVKLMCS